MEKIDNTINSSYQLSVLTLKFKKISKVELITLTYELLQ